MWLHLPNSRSYPSALGSPASISELNSLARRLKPSATWKTKLLPLKSWLRVLKTECSTMRLFGQISKPLAGDRGAAASITSWPVIHASRSRALENKKGKKTRAISGRTSRGLSARSNRLGSSSKTSPIISGSDFMKSPASYERWATGLRLDCLARLKLARRIFASGCSSWPTARGEDSESCGNHPGATDSLTGAARSWPTPRAGEAMAKRHNKRHGRCLEQETQNWATPNGHDATGARGKGFELTDRHYKPHDLVSQTGNWQTPASDSFRSRGGDRVDEMGLDQQARTWRTPDAPHGGGVRTRNKSRGRGHQTTVAEQAESWPTPQASDVRGGAGERQNLQKEFAATARASLPLFPPGPDALEAWREIIRIDPTLKPALRGTPDELSARLDDKHSPRVARLRALGNGVVPLVAGFAFSVLLRKYTSGIGLVRSKVQGD